MIYFSQKGHKKTVGRFCLAEFIVWINGSTDVPFIISLVKSEKLFVLNYEHNIEGMTLVFQELVEELLNEIYNLEVNFEHNSEAKYCGYCT